MIVIPSDILASPTSEEHERRDGLDDLRDDRLAMIAAP
jgi:hypothetical protein